MKFRFSIRDLLWLTVAVALAVGWWLDHERLSGPKMASAPQVSLDVAGPETADPGTDVRFTITITNRGYVPVSNLMIVDRYDAGLKHAINLNPLQNALPCSIEPGKSRQVGITFRITQPGKLCHVVEIIGPGIHEVKTVCVTVTAPPPP